LIAFLELKYPFISGWSIAMAACLSVGVMSSRLGYISTTDLDDATARCGVVE
jgi:hypothetical protein